MASAIVLRASGGVYDVELADGTVAEASLRGRLKLQQRTGDRVVAGDIVTLDRQSDGALTIESVLPRRSEIARRAPGHGRKAKVIVANIDRMIIVFAAASPTPNRRLLDRFLVLAEANEVEPFLVLNKAELVSDDEAATFLAPYVAAGYRTLLASAKTGTGLDELRALLCSGESVIAGPSGVGKSTLVNAVQPGLGLRVGEVSEAVNKGQHTTVTAQLIPLECGGYVADTPGLRELGLWRMDPADLAWCFPEFRSLVDECRFGSSCSHTHEPACAVHEAATAGTIDAERYHSYCALYEESREQPR
jgi:ribosome biogenesis GTPase / thiamine phosphate phosphatase